MVSGKLYINFIDELIFLQTNISLFPATRSRTATLLRLHPNHQSYNELFNFQVKLALRM